MNFELSSFYSNYNLGCKGSEKSRIMQEFVAFLKKVFFTRRLCRNMNGEGSF